MALKERVFSGMQPTGSLHLGNYLGAMLQWIELQKTHECMYCVVDLHAITVWQDPQELRRAIRQVTAAYIAAGLDPKKSILFNQSQVSAHAELAWVFNCVARLGWLNRMTQFKEKAGKDRENASVGLYAYPNLMAADILAYKATHVPVGEDQKQHLELSRDIAQKFNNDFRDEIMSLGYAEGVFFPQPEPVITGPATRVMSLRDGTKKMSKSDPSDLSRINLTDDADTIARKVQKAKTDPEPLPSEAKGLEGRPEADLGKIGIAGCSIGGQIALQGGAYYPAIGAVWADGASIIRYADIAPVDNLVAWIAKISNIPLDWLFQWVVGIKAPPAMIEIIGNIAPRPVMLVAGGKATSRLGSEAPQAEYFAAYAGENAQVWVIPEAVHCDGPKRDPVGYEARLLDFFDTALGIKRPE